MRGSAVDVGSVKRRGDRMYYEDGATSHRPRYGCEYTIYEFYYFISFVLHAFFSTREVANIYIYITFKALKVVIEYRYLTCQAMSRSLGPFCYSNVTTYSFHPKHFFVILL